MVHKVLARAWAALVLILAFALSVGAALSDEIIRPKVMVIATYETGKDRGDVPGELQNWVERENLDQAIQVPGIEHPILTNGKGLYAMVCGTTSRCAVQMMALVMDKRFDFRKTYFLLSGIAGGDPAACSVGSAVWIQYVVDGDPIFEIDNRETAPSWPYGIVALGATEPGKAPPNVDSVGAAGVSDGAGGVGKVVFKINPSLEEWAYDLTKNMTLPDPPDVAKWRMKYKAHPKALLPPTIMEGDSLGSDRFWHGEIMNQWAEDWVHIYTRGKGALVMSDCEDQGMGLAMSELDQLGLVDWNRLLILRTASNYTVPPPGVSAAKDLFDSLVVSPGYLPALDDNYRVGSVVVGKLLAGWVQYEKSIP